MPLSKRPNRIGDWSISTFVVAKDTGYSIIGPDGMERARFGNGVTMAYHYAMLSEYVDRLEKECEVFRAAAEERADKRKAKP